MQTVIHFRKQVPSLNLNPEVEILEVDFWLYGRHLVKSIWRHNPAMDQLIMTKFRTLKRNHMRRTKHRSRSKSEVKFKYSGSPFSETGSSFISAVHWDISSKFGMQTVIHFLKQVPTLNLNSEVDFWLYGRHFVKSMRRHNPALDRLIMTKFGRLKQNHMPRSKQVNIEIGSKIPIWRQSFFRNRK